MRPHWENCITHADERLAGFVTEYFGAPERRCLLVAAAGFDPRSVRIAEMLGATLGDRLSAIVVREERRTPSANLISAADANEAAIRRLVPACSTMSIDVFGDDGAAIGGIRIARELDRIPLPPGTTDVVLDLTALSIGIGFPAAKLLLHKCEQDPNLTFHIMIASNPDLDDRITAEPGDRPMAVHGFAGPAAAGTVLEVATIWLPMLARGRAGALAKIGTTASDYYKICPVVPFPARNPRRADELLDEYRQQLVDEWATDPRDLVFVSETNPLDCYRTLSTLKQRYDRTVAGTYEPQIILSPVGSRVIAAGALMAAIEHDMPVHYVETVRYELADIAAVAAAPAGERLVHVILSGAAYGDYGQAVALPKS